VSSICRGSATGFESESPTCWGNGSKVRRGKRFATGKKRSESRDERHKTSPIDQRGTERILAKIGKGDRTSQGGEKLDR